MNLQTEEQRQEPEREVEQRIKVWESAEKMRAFHVDDSVKEYLKKGIAKTSNSGMRRDGEWDRPR